MSSGALEVELIDELGALAGLRPEWDGLAVADALPLMAPDWVIAWLEHLAPADAVPRVVCVRERGALIGLAPFYVREGRRGRIDYRLPGIELAARLAPLAAPGREWEVAGAIAGALAGASPRPDLVALEGMPPESCWLAALRELWPGRVRPFARTYHVHGCPTVTLAGTYESWLSSRGASFRKNLRRRGRMLEAEGGALRLGTPETLEADVASLLELHAGRWRERGESSLLTPGERMPAMLIQAGRALTPSGRFRVWLAEVEGRPIWANLFLSAGGELLAVNSGWDEEYARLSPPLLGMARAIEDAYARGERRLDIGIGDDSFKLQFANGNAPVAWGILAVANRRLAATAARTAPMLASGAVRDAAKRTLTPEQIERLRGARRKLAR
ncbi:MAG TPA: GNAT family N-acetyltransferase [Solirubrobacteraceae bacterium]|nr:GNAT family N-acetyltransferase [Solirubrobacteraceae bacterium]